MRKSEIEAWALRVIDAVVAGHPSEDDHVELKADWMASDQDFARRLAGHANSARGEPILWLFGVDERGRRVPGVQAKDPAAWWPQVIRSFDGEAPQPLYLSVPYENVVVAALFVETDRAPFVVKNPHFGQAAGVVIATEVPWRANTSTRSATRADLLRLLVPAVRTPTFEVQQIRASIQEQSKTTKSIVVEGHGYLTYLAEQRLHIPDHLIQGRLACAGGAEMPIVKGRLTPSLKYDEPHDRHVSANPMFERNDEDLTVRGPGHLSLWACGELVRKADRMASDDNFDDFSFTTRLTVELRFHILGSDLPLVIDALLSPAMLEGKQGWKLP